MQTVTTAEACESLPELLARIEEEPVLIRDGEQDVAVLLSPERFIEEVRKEERLKRVLEFERVRNAAATELATSLAREGLTVEQFLQELLA